MLKLFVFWSLFALVVMGVVVTLVRNRARLEIDRAYARERSAKLAAAKANALATPLDKPHTAAKAHAVSSPAAPVSPAAAGAAHPRQAMSPQKVVSSEPAAFDPGATRVHFGASVSDVALAELEREQDILPAASVVKLVCVGGHLKGKSFPITVAGITVGRDPTNAIAITDPRVSSHHAWVGIVESKVVLRDLGSTNGTFLNAHMGSLVQEVVLSPGDTVFFGGHGGDQFRLVVG